MSIFKKRSVFRVEWSKIEKCWGVLAPGKWNSGVNPLRRASSKSWAVQMGATIAAGVWQNEGQISQLVVHCKDGHIAFEPTYGWDPKRFKG